jgi:hypothetical protein
MNVPNLFIVGVAKGGTTALSSMLAGGTEVFSPAIKEPHYFSADIDPTAFRKDYLADHQIVSGADDKLVKPLAFFRNLAAYESLYSEGEGFKYRLDASTSYLFSNVAAENIYRSNPDARIICVVREPLSRVVSHLMMDIRAGYCSSGADSLTVVKRDYEQGSEKWGRDALYIGLCLYRRQLARYLDIFPRKQLLIINYDTWNKDQSRVKAALDSWLGTSLRNRGFEARINGAYGRLRFGISARSMFLLRLLASKFPPVARRLGRRILFDYSSPQELHNYVALAEYVEKVCLDDWRFALENVDL